MPVRLPYTLSTAGTCILVLLVTSSCRKPSVQIYDVPKDTALTSKESPAAASPPQVSPEPTWSPAVDWEILEPTEIRKGNYRFEDSNGVATITVTAFPGNTGGLLANVNRWLRQASLPSIDSSELQSVAQPARLGGSDAGRRVDLDPGTDQPQAVRILAGILPHGGKSWFFKMTGPQSTVATQVGAFDQMLSSISLPASPARAPRSDSDSQIAFQAPAGWTPSQGSSMRVASFSIEQEGSETADFSIIAFPGETGGVAANVNRWRRQISLPPWSIEEVSQAAQETLNSHGHRFEVFDLNAKAETGAVDGRERILAAIMEHGGKSWFFKLRGEPFLVETQLSKFRSLLLSVRFEPETSSENP